MGWVLTRGRKRPCTVGFWHVRCPQRARHLDVLKHAADSAEMKASRRALLHGLFLKPTRSLMSCAWTLDAEPRSTACTT